MRRLLRFARFPFCLAVPLAFLSGCSGSTTSEFEFRNRSESPIWVNNVSEFQHDPMCGHLEPGATARLSLPPQKLPEYFAIEWWRVFRKYRMSDTLSAPLTLEGTLPNERGGVLVFEYQEDETWRLWFAQKRE